MSAATAEEELACLAGPAAVRFTHGDLIPKNIMVSPDGAGIIGIIDWGNSGFYPDYWEYCRMHDPFQTSPGWKEALEVVWPDAPPEWKDRTFAIHDMLEAVFLFCP